MISVPCFISLDLPLRLWKMADKGREECFWICFALFLHKWEQKVYTKWPRNLPTPTKVIQKRGRMNGIVFRFIKNISANKRKYLWVVHNMAEQKCGNWWVDKKRFEKGQSGPGSWGQWGQIFIRCHQVRKVKLRPHIRLIRSLRNWNIVYIPSHRSASTRYWFICSGRWYYHDLWLLWLHCWCYRCVATTGSKHTSIEK